MQVNLELKTIIGMIDGETSVDPSFLIEKISSLENAGPKDLAILFDPEDNSVFDPISLEVVNKCNAGIIIASKKATDSKNFLLVKNPLHAYQKLIDHIISKKYSSKQNDISSNSYISPKASIATGCKIGYGVIVEEGAKLGTNCLIGANSYIGYNVEIGDNVVLYPGVKILDRCIVGSNSIIHAGAVIGADGFGYRASKTGLGKIPHVGIVRIGKHVEIGANTCIDRAAFEETVIGDGTKIDNLVHISHNVKIGLHCAILAQTAIAGSVTIGSGCQIGGQVVIKDHVTIGNGVKIVAKSGVMRNLSDGEIVAGVPSMPFQKWKRLVVGLGKFQEIFSQVTEIKNQVEQYRKLTWWQKLFKKF